jgi:hypothetical protein
LNVYGAGGKIVKKGDPKQSVLSYSSLLGEICESVASQCRLDFAFVFSGGCGTSLGKLKPLRHDVDKIDRAIIDNRFTLAIPLGF